MEVIERKLKVYLDTSVISYLIQSDAPEKMSETRQVWELFKGQRYDVFVSIITLDEINKCSDYKRNAMLQELSKIKFRTLRVDDEVKELADKIIKLGILSNRSLDDARHIAAAVVAQCDCILSWNFRHIVNVKTIRGVRALTNLSGYKQIEIWQPSVLLGSKEA